MSEFRSHRFHIIIDAWNCNPAGLGDKPALEKVIKEIAKICEMRILHGPVVVEGVPENPGLTGFAIIDYSHISIHTFTESQELCVDVFSCKQFDINKVKDFVKNAFSLEGSNTKTIEVKHA
ncbi:MAG: S-adenosylmethionine decarboxylase [Candidatus Aenigmarchaeota archaeon]|nr:S-adenosylmethionine decarboxylase [Candidatus Aenigmarchaeota archaeon]